MQLHSVIIWVASTHHRPITESCQAVLRCCHYLPDGDEGRQRWFGASFTMREIHSSPVYKELINFLYSFSNLNSSFSLCSHPLASSGITICLSSNTSGRFRLLQPGFDYSGRRTLAPLRLSWCTVPGSGISNITIKMPLWLSGNSALVRKSFLKDLSLY